MNDIRIKEELFDKLGLTVGQVSMEITGTDTVRIYGSIQYEEESDYHFTSETELIIKANACLEDGSIVATACSDAIQYLNVIPYNNFSVTLFQLLSDKPDVDYIQLFPSIVARKMFG